MNNLTQQPVTYILTYHNYIKYTVSKVTKAIS